MLPLIAEILEEHGGSKKKDFGDSAGGTRNLGVTAACRTRAGNGCPLRWSRGSHRRHYLPPSHRNPGDARGLSCTRGALVAPATAEAAQPMTRSIVDTPPPVREKIVRTKRRQRETNLVAISCGMAAEGKASQPDPPARG